MTMCMEIICPRCHFARDHCQCAPDPEWIKEVLLMNRGLGHGPAPTPSYLSAYLGSFPLVAANQSCPEDEE